MENSAATNGDSAKDGSQPPERRRLKRFACALGAVLILLVALIALVEFRIPLDWARARIESAASPGHRLQIRLRGPLTLITGLQPALEAHDVVLSVQRESGAVELARLGVARTGIELRALFAREVHPTNARASDLVLRIDAATFAAAALGQDRRAGRPATTCGRCAIRLALRRRAQLAGRSRARAVRSARAQPSIGDRGRVDDVEGVAKRAGDDRSAGDGSGRSDAGRFSWRSFTRLLAGKRAIPLDLRFTLADASFYGNGTLDLAQRHGDYQVALKGNGRSSNAWCRASSPRSGRHRRGAPRGVSGRGARQRPTPGGGGG